MKTSKIKTIQGAGEKNGWLNYEVELEDGATGAKGFKTQPSHLNIGTEVEYEMNEAYPDFFKTLKVKGYQAKQFNSYKGKSQGSTASFALAYAKDMAVAHIEKGNEFKAEQVLEVASKFNNWLKDNA